MSLFKLEIIDGRGVSDKYLRRWTLLNLWNGRVIYLHHFVGSDWAGDLHDHPKAFISIGLWGGYVEEYIFDTARYRSCASNVARRVLQKELTARCRFVAPWIRRFPPGHIHRLRINRAVSCWTLLYAGPIKREWGFYSNGRWVHWTDYLGIRP